MTVFGKTEKGIVVPKRKAIQCGYCPRPIFKEHEPTGRLKIVNGMPMCPTCRVIKLDKNGKRILGDKKLYKQDVAAAEKLAEKHEQERVEEISATSIEKSGTQNKRVRRNKKL